MEPHSAALCSRHSVENPDGFIALDSKASRDTLFCTLQWTTSTHSPSAFSLGVSLLSIGLLMHRQYSFKHFPDSHYVRGRLRKAREE